MPYAALRHAADRSRVVKQPRLRATRRRAQPGRSGCTGRDDSASASGPALLGLRLLWRHKQRRPGHQLRALPQPFIPSLVQLEQRRDRDVQLVRDEQRRLVVLCDDQQPFLLLLVLLLLLLLCCGGCLTGVMPWNW